MAKYLVQILVQYLRPGLQQKMGPTQRPLHLLLLDLDESFAFPIWDSSPYLLGQYSVSPNSSRFLDSTARTVANLPQAPAVVSQLQKVQVCGLCQEHSLWPFARPCRCRRDHNDAR